ncbi:protein arginine kinase [Roseibacillus ishigakijimensis]|uniref:Protein-arginine kinase n=2 Tax=Roseibacillus ishigakijimensis TaxID=454146 RepID=A0A934RKM2_9BACT|nr:protein arginine kinase [Roseibacillus ishigakijimensis]
MRFSTLLKNPADWMANDREEPSVVLTSRVRLARNLANEPFPGWSRKEERVTILSRLREEVEDLPGMKGAFSQGLETLNSLQKQTLVERHLISREQAARGEGSAVVVNRKQTFSLMLNEEDHLRMQSIRPGLNLSTAFSRLSDLESELSRRVEFAFDDRLGYLTACPTNLGTGMRASAMLHLPGLVLSDEVGPVLQGVARLRLAVRGFYGEGTESLGNLFQISNQSTLGESEEDIIARLERVISDVEAHELNARQRLLEKDPTMILDRVGRSYGILRHAHAMESKEALNLLSLLRLGGELGYFEKGLRRVCDLLLMDIQPAHLQLYAGDQLDPAPRDVLRAEIIRARLQSLAPPAITTTTLKEPDEPGKTDDE